MTIQFVQGKLGGGGWVMDHIISPDKLTELIRTDVYTPYIWEPVLGPAGSWRPLINGTSLPVEDRILGNNGNGFGCYGIDVSRVDSDFIAAIFPGLSGINSTLYVSQNRGLTFTKPGNLSEEMAVQNTDYRMFGKKMMIHPTNKDIIIVTTNAGKIMRTTNRGVTFSQVAGLPDDGLDPCVQFDFSDGSKVYVGYRTGDHRLWRSLNAGATFSQMTGGPDNLRRMTSSVNGKIYMTEFGVTHNVWRLVGTTFTNLDLSTLANSLQLHTIAVSEVNPDRVTAQFEAGNIETSLDGGDTWGGMYGNAPLADIPPNEPTWFGYTHHLSFFSGDIAYDPITEDLLHFAEGIGDWSTTPPLDDARPTWTPRTRGNDELIVDDVRWAPGGRRPIISTQDRGNYKLLEFSTFPEVHGPGNSVALQHCYGFDYATHDPDFLAFANNGGPGHYYTDDNCETYQPFASQPSGAYGNMACLSPQRILHCPSNNGFPEYTIDGGASWHLCTFPGDVPTSGESGFGFLVYLNLKYVAADRVLDIYYAYNYVTGDMYRSADFGANFTKTADAVTIAGGIGQSQAILTVPGQAGHAFFTSGTRTGGAHPISAPMKRSNNANADSATWTDVSNTQEVWALGFCAPAPGQAYPAIMMVGYANGDLVPGVYQSIDNCVTWVLLTNAPANSLDLIRAIAGNPEVFGEFVLGMSGSGYIYTRVNDAVMRSAGQSLGFAF